MSDVGDEPVRSSVSLGRAGERLGISGGDIRRATGARRVSEAQLAEWLATPPAWLVRSRIRKAANQRRAANERRKTATVPVTCVACGRSELRRPATARAVHDLILVCDDCDRAGRKPAVVMPAGWRLGRHPEVAGGFVGWELQEPPRPGSHEELAEAYLRAFKDRGDTDAWAAGVLHRAGVHEIDLGGGVVVPVLPPPLRMAE
jgi:hypothetical protein